MAVKTDKKRKKKWYRILAPKEFSFTEVGESYLDDPLKLKGKKFFVNLMSLTNEPKKQNIKVQLVVNSVKDNQGMTEMVGYEMLPSQVKRVGKRAKSKVDDSFLCETKESKKVKIKPLISSKKDASKAVIRELRLKGRKVVKDFVKSNNYPELLRALLNNSFSKLLKTKLKKIVPLSTVSIRAVYLVEGKK